MKTRTKVLLLGLVLLLGSALAFAPESARFFALYSCADTGGSYNFKLRECDYKQEHPVPGKSQEQALSPFVGFALAAFGLSSLLVGLRLRRRGQSQDAMKEQQ